MALSWDGDHYSGHGNYLGVKTVAMSPGDKFATMLVPDGTVWQVYSSPNSAGKYRPLFSTPEANPTFNGSGSNQVADITGAGTIFGYEDTALNSGLADQDYNDMIFRVSGATGTAPALSTVVNHKYDISRTGLESQIIA